MELKKEVKFVLVFDEDEAGIVKGIANNTDHSESPLAAEIWTALDDLGVEEVDQPAV